MGQIKYQLPPEEVLAPGHFACPGCGATLTMRYALKALGRKTVAVIPACCWSVIDGPVPYSAAGVPVFHTAFETAASTASGVKAGLDALGDNETTVLAFAGDGGTFDIGLQALSGAAERNEDFIYICYDNEAYMNTGIQRSSATPFGAWTTTTPTESPKAEKKKNIVEILAAHRIPYLATASVAYPDDMISKIRKAKDIRGFKFIHVFSPCPPGWKFEPEDSIKISRMAIESKVFPLIEIFDGTNYTLSKEPEGVPVRDYIKMQGRFRHLDDKQIGIIQRNVDEEWDRLQAKFPSAKQLRHAGSDELLTEEKSLHAQSVPRKKDAKKKKQGAHR
ncbi:MAG: 3-methyl-2-oxobutanoate dehydrogenase subunit beta [Bacteroidetes bacterium]|nr:3-methyl-2-oxobutanoate dehydrogenase subunit beta [Bacteroidota bacterium]